MYMYVYGSFSSSEIFFQKDFITEKLLTVMLSNHTHDKIVHSCAIHVLSNSKFEHQMVKWKILKNYRFKNVKCFWTSILRQVIYKEHLM